MEVDVVQEIMNGDGRRNLIQREGRQQEPVTYERIMATHRDTLAELNISLCRECFIPIKKEGNGIMEYCEDCVPAR